MHSSLYISREDKIYTALDNSEDTLSRSKSLPSMLTINASLSPVENIPSSCSSPHFLIDVPTHDPLLTGLIASHKNVQEDKADNKSCCCCCDCCDLICCVECTHSWFSGFGYSGLMLCFAFGR